MSNHSAIKQCDNLSKIVVEKNPYEPKSCKSTLTLQPVPKGKGTTVDQYGCASNDGYYWSPSQNACCQNETCEPRVILRPN